VVVRAVYLYNLKKAHFVNELFVQSMYISPQSDRIYLLSRNEMRSGMQKMRARGSLHDASVIPLVHICGSFKQVPSMFVAKRALCAVSLMIGVAKRPLIGASGLLILGSTT
jgi:hypothetical protein